MPCGVELLAVGLAFSMAGWLIVCYLLAYSIVYYWPVLLLGIAYLSREALWLSAISLIGFIPQVNFYIPPFNFCCENVDLDAFVADKNSAAIGKKRVKINNIRGGDPLWVWGTKYCI